MSASKELQYNIWDDDEGLAMTVGHDADSLGLVHVKNRDQASEDFWGKVDFHVSPAFARHLADALMAVANDIEQQEKKA